MYDNHIVKNVTQTTFTRNEIHSRFDALVENLTTGKICEVGGYTIRNSHLHQGENCCFDAIVIDPLTGIATPAEVSIKLSPYENLLGDKVDIDINGTRLLQSWTDVTFSVSSEIQ